MEEPHFSNLWQSGVPGEVEAFCVETGVTHLRFPQELHQVRERIFPRVQNEFRTTETANTRCADAIQYGLQHLRNLEPVLILDADMIPFRPFEPIQLLDEFPLWGVLQNRGPVSYLWNGIMLYDPSRLNMGRFNIDCGIVDGVNVDVGGMLHGWLSDNWQSARFFRTELVTLDWIHWMDTHLPLPLRDFFEWQIRTFPIGRPSDIYGEAFVHLGGGGNWEVREASLARERIDRFCDAVLAL